MESATGRLQKEAILLREMEKCNSDFFSGLQLACDKSISFGVKIVDEYKVPSDHGDDYEFSDFIALTNKLISRELSGNAAKTAIFEFGCKCSSHTWNNWCRRILVKDLDCGVNTKTINKCAKKYPKYAVPNFACQLAEDSKRHASKLSGMKILQEKLDGTRVLTIVYPNGVVNQYTRNGKELLNFGHIKDEFANMSSTLKEAMVFDGEIMSSSFQALMTQLRRKVDVQSKDSILYCFDIIPLSDFLLGKCDIPQIDRINMLNRKGSPLNNMKSVKLLDYIMVDLDTDEGHKIYNDFNNRCVNDGKEGIMIKDPSAPYECIRSTAWMKLKPVLTVDLSIVDLQEGEDKFVGKLGAFICRGIEDGKEIYTKVGSGIGDELRSHFWENRDSIIGKIVEIKCDAITQNQNGTYSLRFPVFVRLRGFDPDEKL